MTGEILTHPWGRMIAIEIEFHHSLPRRDGSDPRGVHEQRPLEASRATRSVQYGIDRKTTVFHRVYRIITRNHSTIRLHHLTLYVVSLARHHYQTVLHLRPLNITANERIEN